MFATDWIAYHAQRTPHKIALIDQYTQQEFTYADLDKRVGLLAGYFQSQWGVQAGDRIAVFGKSSSFHFEIQFACYRLSAMFLPLNWRLAEPELITILEDSEPIGFVYDNEFTDRVGSLIDQYSLVNLLRIDVVADITDESPNYEDAIANSRDYVDMPPYMSLDTAGTLMYTTPTSGVIITQGMTLWNAINVTVDGSLNTDSIFYNVLPTFHTAGLNLYVNPSIYVGGTSIVARDFVPDLALQTLTNKDLGVTHFFAVPAIYLFLTKAEGFATADFSHIKRWNAGGAPLPVELLGLYQQMGVIIQNGYGMTETGPVVFATDEIIAQEKPRSSGRLVIHTRVRIVDQYLNDVPQGEIGEILISGPNISRGYWNRPDIDENSFTTDEYGIQWLHSGDAGLVDEDGCYFIVDRFKDMYISGGENVYPIEAEQVIRQLEAILEVAVIGVADEIWGETGLAIVVANDDIAVEEIITHCEANLAKYKVPRQIVFADTLPKDPTGSVLKDIIREQYAPK